MDRAVMEMNALARFTWLLRKWEMCSHPAYAYARQELNRKRDAIVYLERLNGGA